MKVSSINQDPIINIVVSRFLNMEVASFVVDLFKNVMDLVVHFSYSVVPYFCGRGEEFLVVIEVYSLWIKAIETSLGPEFVGSSGCSITGKFCKR